MYQGIKQRLIESYNNDRYYIYEFDIEGNIHFVIKDNETKEEVIFSSYESCHNYFKENKIKHSKAKKINKIIENIVLIDKKSDFKNIDCVLDEIEEAMNNFKRGKIVTSDMNIRTKVYQQVIAIHALKYNLDKFNYIKSNVNFKNKADFKNKRIEKDLNIIEKDDIL